MVIARRRKKFEAIYHLKNHPWSKNCELTSIFMHKRLLSIAIFYLIAWSLKFSLGTWWNSLICYYCWLQAVFRRYKCPEKDHLSFSLIYKNGDRSLDLVGCNSKSPIFHFLMDWLHFRFIYLYYSDSKIIYWCHSFHSQFYMVCRFAKTKQRQTFGSLLLVL